MAPRGLSTLPTPTSAGTGRRPGAAGRERAGEQLVEHREGLVELERALHGAAGDIAGRAGRSDRLEEVVPQVRAFAAQVAGDAGGAGRRPDGAEAVGVIAGENADAVQACL